MSTTVTCTNPDCTEAGVAKPVLGELPPGITFVCGACGEACDTADDDG